MFRLSIFVVLPTVMWGQALLSHGLAAGGGSLAGGMAGKKVSDVLNRVRDVQEVAEKAGTVKTARQAFKHEPVIAPAPTVDHIAPSRRRPVTVVASRPKAIKMDAVPELPAIANVPTVMVIPSLAPVIPGEASVQELRAITQGAARDDVVSKLGIPASKVCIPETGGMREIWYYTKKGDVSGAVRMVNGVVAAVQVN